MDLSLSFILKPFKYLWGHLVFGVRRVLGVPSLEEFKAFQAKTEDWQKQNSASAESRRKMRADRYNSAYKAALSLYQHVAKCQNRRDENFEGLEDKLQELNDVLSNVADFSPQDLYQFEVFGRHVCMYRHKSYILNASRPTQFTSQENRTQWQHDYAQTQALFDRLQSLLDELKGRGTSIYPDPS